MNKGDIVLITFPFTDLSGSKLRPAVVLTTTDLDLTVCFITSQIDWQESTDVLLLPTPGNGLKKQSLIRTSKIATLDKSLAKSEGLLGRLSTSDIQDSNSKLKILFQLS
ncbi:type II toxin-antitoxin system PemK/MazF family toxin [Spirosoma rhododendri]|uniref:Type II toxin-antitoxin system PemK/MazF family toxin n=1 Tax=Spirosoma rhododendri TaxID=2728024 RepID=A0A7L5DYV5_9BACT|nr:type II toxin-antitoxin system PemK/MazF family toxin [Spirosoma rhododendri]QJD80690.1 type II toxin-antitoxin system PemK/MazF family toxin [Spirosoma rhododendri]